MNSEKKVIKKSRLKKVLIIIFLLYIVISTSYLIIWACISGPDVTYRVISNCCDSDIDDHKNYPGRDLLTGNNAYNFKQTNNDKFIPKKISIKNKEDIDLEGFLEASDSIAFLVIKDDVIRYEKYFQGHSANTVSMGFSASKSILSILIGIAIDEGIIQSVDQSVTDYIPELKKNGFDKVTLKSLLQMHSGIDYTENDNPFGEHVKFNYTSNLRAAILNLKVLKNPSPDFAYKSADNAVLGLVLDRALKKKTISQYTQEKLWEPLGMEHDGIWTLDSKKGGLEKTWCCLSATAKDFAKFGCLYLAKGNWNGTQIVSEKWVDDSITGAFTPATWPKYELEEGFENYGYEWWICSSERKDILARGKNGQFIYVNYSKNIVIVRLGWSTGDAGFGKLSHGDWLSLFVNLSESLKN